MSDATDTPSSDQSRVAAGSGLGLLGALVRQSLTALTYLLLARLLTHPDFGLIQLGVAFVVLLSELGKAGLDVAVGRFVALYLASGEMGKVKGAIYGGLGWVSLFSVVLAGAVSWLAPQIAGWYQKPEFAAPLRYFIWWMPAVLVTAILVTATLSRGTARARVNVRDLTTPALFLAFAGVALLLRPSAEAIAAAYTLSAMVAVVLAVWYLRKIFPELPRVRAEYSHAALLGFALPSLATGMAAMGLAQADVVVLGRLTFAAAVGTYAAAAHLSALGTLPLNALTQILAPVVSRLHHQQKHAELESLMQTFTRLCLVVSAPLLALFIGLASPLMGLFGKDFISGAWVLIIASLGVLVNVGTGPVGYALVMAGYQWYGFVNNVLFLGVLGGSMWYLTPRYGIVGAAWGMVLAGSLANLSRLLLVRRLLHVNPLSLAMLKPLVAAAAAGGVAYGLARALHLTGAEHLYVLAPAIVGASLAGSAVYVLVLRLWGLEPSDREVGESLLSRLKAQFGR